MTKNLAADPQVFGPIIGACRQTWDPVFLFKTIAKGGFSGMIFLSFVFFVFFVAKSFLGI